MKVYWDASFTSGCTFGVELIETPTFVFEDSDDDIMEVSLDDVDMRTMVFFHLFIFKLGVGIW